jgi:hypothetical protein
MICEISEYDLNQSNEPSSDSLQKVGFVVVKELRNLGIILCVSVVPGDKGESVGAWWLDSEVLFSPIVF